MQSWLANQLLAYNLRRLNAGDPGPTLRLDADDVVLHFPGDSAWSGEFRGKDQVRGWLDRFTRVGLQTFADEVVLKGFPWKQTLCIRGHDYLRSSGGELVYENRYVIWGRLEWGKVKDYEVYEDTQKSKAFDEWLEAHEAPAPSVAPVGSGRAPAHPGGGSELSE